MQEITARELLETAAWVTSGRVRVENRTPHPIVLMEHPNAPSGPGVVAELPSLGEARASVTRETVGTVPIARPDPPSWSDPPMWYMAPVVRPTFGAVVGLPDPEPDVFHVVSRIAAEAARASGRSTDDLLIPDDLVRGPDGQPIGCLGFAQL